MTITMKIKMAMKIKIKSHGFRSLERLNQNEKL